MLHSVSRWQCCTGWDFNQILPTYLPTSFALLIAIDNTNIVCQTGLLIINDLQFMYALLPHSCYRLSNESTTPLIWRHKCHNICINIIAIVDIMSPPALQKYTKITNGNKISGREKPTFWKHECTKNITFNASVSLYISYCFYLNSM